MCVDDIQSGFGAPVTLWSAGAHLFPTHHRVTLVTWEYLDHWIDEDSTQFPAFRFSTSNSHRAKVLDVSSVGMDLGFSLHQFLFINYFLACNMSLCHRFWTGQAGTHWYIHDFQVSRELSRYTWRMELLWKQGGWDWELYSDPQPQPSCTLTPLSPDNVSVGCEHASNVSSTVSRGFQVCQELLNTHLTSHQEPMFAWFREYSQCSPNYRPWKQNILHTPGPVPKACVWEPWKIRCPGRCFPGESGAVPLWIWGPEEGSSLIVWG